MSPEDLIGTELMKKLDLSPGHIFKGMVGPLTIKNILVLRLATSIPCCSGYYGHLV